MASSSGASGGSESKKSNSDREKGVMVGELPPDFLRVTPVTAEQQLENDEQAAMALQQQLAGSFVPANVTGRLSISIIEAKLVKNYGMTRMDPYVRLRIGHTVYETPTDHNGAKNPRWNKVFHCFLFPSVNSIYIEIFDECAFSLDERIAWAHYTIPDSVFHGEALDEWVPLNGRQGDGKEGFINLVLTYTPIPAGTVVYPSQPVVAVMPTPYYIATGPYVPATYPPPQPQPPAVVSQTAVPQPVRSQPVQISAGDVAQIKEMFPSLEEDVIKSVLQSHNGNKDAAINALLAMSEDS